MHQSYILKLVLLLLLSQNGMCKKKKDAPKMGKYSIPMNRTLTEELHLVKEVVLTVKQDLFDIMTDVKGLHKTLRQSEARISELEKQLKMNPEDRDESTGSGPMAQALMTKTTPKEGETTTTATTTTGEGPPRFMEKYVLPGEVSVEVGETATLRCPVTGDPLPKIMWLKNRMLFARKMAMTEAIKWKLKLHQVLLEDSGNFTCVVRNKHGIVKHTFQLKVFEKTTTTTITPATPTTTTRKPKPMKEAMSRKKPKERKSPTTTSAPPKKSKPSEDAMSRKKPKGRSIGSQSSPRSKPSMKEKQAKPNRFTKPKTTKSPPRNEMAPEAPPLRRIPPAVASREIIDDGEMCEAKMAAGGKPPMRDCWDLKMYHCKDKSGLYNVSLEGQTYTVYCDMATDGGGWIVFQRRIDGKVNFNRDWDTYKNGFGKMADGDFWWGNEKLYLFTRDRRMRIRIDMADDLNSTFVEYDGFWISRETDFYRLNVEGFRGRGGEAFIQPVWEEESHNEMMFSTRDIDRDGSLANCAAHFGGGWWYNDCYSANLNGVYPRENTKKTPSLQWKPWKGPRKYLTAVTMKIRPAIAPSSVTWDFWYPEKDDSFRLHEHYRIYGGCC